MAPRNTANLDCNRYSLRAWKQQASFEKIVPENVTTKADFLNLFGLTLCNNNIRTSINCQNRAESGCKCSDNNSDNKMSEIMDNTDKDSTTLRPCWVVVPNEQCTSCKRIFKCKSDLTNHVQKKHKSNKVKKRVRMVLRIGQEIVREKYVKKKHLAPSCSIQRSPSDYIDPLVKEGFNCNRISTPIVDDTPTLSPSSSSSLLNSDESANDDRLSDSLESQNSNDSSNHRLSPTAPSIGTEMELPVCHVESNCFVKNIISKTQNDLEDMQDQNNNSFCNKNNDNNNNNNNSNNNNNNEEDLSILSNTSDKKTHETLEINETIENEDHDSESEDIECCSRSVSVQTPSCWEYRTLTLLEYSRALEADKRRQKEEEEEEDKRAAASANAAAALAARVNDEADVITIDDDIDNSIERKFNETNDLPLDYPMKETTEDSEIEEIIEITRQQPEKPLLISDAIQALIATESTMQHLETLKKYKNNDLLIKNFEDVDFEDNDDVLSCATLHLHSDENHHFDDFDTFDIAHFQKNIVDDDVSLHLIDSEEKNYTFNIKDDFDYEEFQMYTMKQMAKAKSLHEEFDSETKSWKKPNHDRLSITSAPISFLSNHQNPSIIIKEELTIDDYSFSTE